MKTNKNRTAKAANNPELGARVRKYTNRIRGHHPIPAETSEKSPMTEGNLGQDLHPSAKIKLQLFPVDDHTRIVLEKDGYHPYLELTLSSRKRISSVLKHLNDKWGGSSIAIGNPVLFPYSISEDLASQQWTLNDTDVSAGDVHTAIGSPSVYRLRYGWVSESETKSSNVPSTSALPLEACLQSKGMEKGCCEDVERCGEGKNIEAETEEYRPSIARGSPDVVGEDKTPFGRLIEDKADEVRPDVGVAQSPAQWDDRMTDISIGGLLSEASLLGRFNNCHSKSTGITGGSQASQLITDSLDAFIAAHIDRSQEQKPPNHGSTSSIFDAEDARDAFPVQQKSSAASRDAGGLSESVHLQTYCQEAGSKSIKDENATEVNILSGLPKGSICHDENSLGLSGIKWTESLGPFDLGLSSSRKIISGDSLNISTLFR